MLQELYIENLAVIQKAVIPFSEHLNAFTGETGAGKSILINGINAVLGQRTTKDIVRTGCEKAVITALFTCLDENAVHKLDELGIDHSNDEITVTREIFADGGSVARVNGRTSAVSVLKEIGEVLITVHGQHDNQILLAPEKHLGVLDSFGGDFTLLEEYRSAFRQLQAMAKKINEIKKSERDKKERTELLRERVEELEAAALVSNEDTELEEELAVSQNADKLSRALQAAYDILSSDEGTCVEEMLAEAEGSISRISNIAKEFGAMQERLHSAAIEIKDISSEIYSAYDSLDLDPKRFQYVSGRLDELTRLKRKYGAEDVSALIDIYEKAQEELLMLEGGEEKLERLSVEKEELLHEVTECAKRLSAYREETAKRFVERVTEELTFLDMPGVVLEVKQERGKLTLNGMDNVELLISANRGEPPKPIARIASGGELSRIMLALKSVIADKDAIPTLIFDEIDTGVSGRAAQKIGIKLRQIGRIRQVLCVTHLTQLAVMADNHLLIEKRLDNGRTVTRVNRLDHEGRVSEIARIMSGENPSELMLKNAEEQLNNAQNL